jgi:hypothetical protein
MRHRCNKLKDEPCHEFLHRRRLRRLTSCQPDGLRGRSQQTRPFTLDQQIYPTHPSFSARSPSFLNQPPIPQRHRPVHARGQIRIVGGDQRGQAVVSDDG